MQRIVICLILVLVLAACGPSATAQPTANVIATSEAVSATMVAATLTAILPTNTLLPPDTTTPTATPNTTPTPKPTRKPKPTAGPKFTGCFTPTGGSKDIAPFKIENMSKNRISVFINGMTRKGEHPIYCSYTLSKGDAAVFDIWWGDYTYMVQVNGKTTYEGSFWVNNDDKATMRITQKGVKLGPFP